MEWIIKYWLQVLFGLMVTGFGLAFRKLRDELRQYKKEQAAIRHGTRGLLADSIMAIHKRAFDRGMCSFADKKNAHELYKQYKALGGNGAIDPIMEEIDNMPTYHHKELERNDYND